GEVVVGAELEPDDALGFVGAGRQHDDRKAGRRLVAADHAADFEPVELRQHQVENYQVRRPRRDRRQCVTPRCSELAGESSFVQVAADERGDVGVVLYDEDSGGHRANCIGGSLHLDGRRGRCGAYVEGVRPVIDAAAGLCRYNSGDVVADTKSPVCLQGWTVHAAMTSSEVTRTGFYEVFAWHRPWCRSPPGGRVMKAFLATV